MDRMTDRRRGVIVGLGVALSLALAASVILMLPNALASAGRSAIFVEDFEGGTLDPWNQVSAGDLALVAGAGPDGRSALTVEVGQHQSFISREDVAHAVEGYLSFWFDPNGVAIPDEGTSWLPGKSIRVATVKGSDFWHVVVALQVRKPAGQGYKGYLEWRGPDGNHYDYSGEFDLVDGWQKVTLGYRIDEWVGVWLDDVQVRELVGVQHEESVGEMVQLGKTNATSNVPTGQILYDGVMFEIPAIGDLWVDAVNGHDSNDGLTVGTPVRTIQRAAETAGPGTTVHILPGVYRETARPLASGGAGEPAVYVAENGPGTAVIRGSEPSSQLAWTQLSANSIGLPAGVDPRNVYFADLSSWGLSAAPRFVVELDGAGNVAARLPQAREPDWGVASEWKYHEFWWAADGGSGVAGCDPASDPDRDCDVPWRSTTLLTDRSDDAAPVGVEAGNLTTLGNLSGATLVAMDTVQGHYVYRRRIVSHDVSTGRVTVDQACEHGAGIPGLGWGSKYYVEAAPQLLDSPGEWWYDSGSGRLYLWPRVPGNPGSADVEISRRETGFDLSHRSYVTLEGLGLEFFNGNAVHQYNTMNSGSHGNVVRNVRMRYANRGVNLTQEVGAAAENITTGFRLEGSEIGYMDTHGIYQHYWWGNGSAADSFSRAGISDTEIVGNELHHLGFRSDSDTAVGNWFSFPDAMRFEGNSVHDVAHHGVLFWKSLIQSSKTYGFDPAEIKTGEILVKDNVFERACQLTADCAGLKFWGAFPDNHVFRDVLLAGNVFRNSMGWTHIAEQRGKFSGGESSEVRGMGAYGLYVDMASGIHVYRNIAYNNANAGFAFAGVWRDGDVVYYNNVVANSLYGFRLGGAEFDRHGGSLNTQLMNNVLVGNEGFGILLQDSDTVYGNMVLDHSLYYNNGWRAWEDGGVWDGGAMSIQHMGTAPNEYYPTLASIQAGFNWEDHGQEGDPKFQAYAVNDHDLHDGSWPDFGLTAGSDKAIDKGTDGLPGSLAALLTLFGVEDARQGAAFDIGRYEKEPGEPAPTATAIPTNTPTVTTTPANSMTGTPTTTPTNPPAGTVAPEVDQVRLYLPLLQR